MTHPFVWPIVNERPRPYWGLGRWLPLGRIHHAPGLAAACGDAPFGWRWFKLWDRNAAILLPLWLYWPIRLWHDRYGYVFRPLVRLGLWRVEEADYYQNGTLTAPHWLKRLAWCFAMDRDQSPDWAALEAAEWRAHRETQRLANARVLHWLRTQRV